MLSEMSFTGSTFPATRRLLGLVWGKGHDDRGPQRGVGAARQLKHNIGLSPRLVIDSGSHSKIGLSNDTLLADASNACFVNHLRPSLQFATAGSPRCSPLLQTARGYRGTGSNASA